MEKSKAEEIISSSYLEAEQLLQNSENHSLPKFEQFLIEYGRKLHPENLIMIRIKHSLCGFYGRYPGFTMNDMAMNPKLLERKIDLINECLETINKIEPGISSMKGKYISKLKRFLYKTKCRFYCEY